MLLFAVRKFEEVDLVQENKQLASSQRDSCIMCVKRLVGQSSNPFTFSHICSPTLMILYFMFKICLGQWISWSSLSENVALEVE